VEERDTERVDRIAGAVACRVAGTEDGEMTPTVAAAKAAGAGLTGTAHQGAAQEPSPLHTPKVLPCWPLAQAGCADEPLMRNNVPPVDLAPLRDGAPARWTSYASVAVPSGPRPMLPWVRGDGRMPPGPAPRVIVVDDDPELGRKVAEHLSRHGFAVRTAMSGAALGNELAVEPTDLVVLDIGMPGENGWSIARRLHARGGVGILIVTAVDDLVDRVVGLERGADDYLPKPFDVDELHARIRAILRRRLEHPSVPAPPAAEQSPQAAACRPDSPNPYRFGRMWLDVDGHRLIARDGTPVLLTAKEFQVLSVFAQNPNRILTRDRIAELAHRRRWVPADRSIDHRIGRLRRKIGDDPSQPVVIKTVRGIGYVFVPASAD
jgi:two-component system, OmpR family, response regulator